MVRVPDSGDVSVCGRTRTEVSYVIMYNDDDDEYPSGLSGNSGLSAMFVMCVSTM